ncbi:MAG: right-handed parallel beta-helix repeat-containing protein [archaeon]
MKEGELEQLVLKAIHDRCMQAKHVQRLTPDYQQAKELLQLPIRDLVYIPEGEYVLTNYLIICPGGRLELSPGVKLFFEKDVGIYSEGVLNASGTMEKPVIIEGKRWANVRLKGAGANTSRFSWCTIRAGESSNGGGISVESVDDILIEDSTLEYNKANYGGGLYVYDCGKVCLTRVLLQNNVARTGGGCYLTTSRFVTFNTVIITSNKAGLGGGVFLQPENTGAQYTLVDTRIIGNEARGTKYDSGGGIFVAAPTKPLSRLVRWGLEKRAVDNLYLSGVSINSNKSGDVLVSTFWYGRKSTAAINIQYDTVVIGRNV